MKIYPWQFDEYRQVGRDYSAAEEVTVYDETHAMFRDIVVESNHVLDRLCLAHDSVLLDIGCGTGTFAIEAARRGLRVHAADVSLTMLDYAKAKSGGLDITFHHAGFLTLDMLPESVDVICSTFAFHHLPDFWKGVAFKRLNKMLKQSGMLYMRDVILEDRDALGNIDTFIGHQHSLGGEFLKQDAEGHFRDEHSTYDWIMDGLLGRADFVVESKELEGGVIGTYVCKKKLSEQAPSAYT